MKIRSALLMAAMCSLIWGPMQSRSAMAAQDLPLANTQQPPVYYVSEFEVTDPEGIKPYSAKVESTFRQFGGRYIVRGGKSETLEGEATKRIVIIAFPSMEQAQAWYESPAYQEIRPIRHRSAKSRVFIVEGFVGTPP